MAKQIRFGTTDFAQNPVPRAPCVLLVDTSASMAGRGVGEFNQMIPQWRAKLLGNGMASKRADIAIVTLGLELVAMEFGAAGEFNSPGFLAEGKCRLCDAIAKAIEMIAARKRWYRQQEAGYCRPGIFWITNGVGDDSFNKAVELVKAEEASRAIAFFPVGVEGADMDRLKQIGSRPPVKLKDLAFTEFFV